MPKDEKDSLSQTNNSFPRECRLRGRTAIRETAIEGAKIRGTWLGLSFIKGDTTRFGISVPRKFGKAVRRNRVKRVMREFLRCHKPLWPDNAWIMIKLFKDPGDESELIEELKGLLAKVR